MTAFTVLPPDAADHSHFFGQPSAAARLDRAGTFLGRARDGLNMANAGRSSPFHCPRARHVLEKSGIILLAISPLPGCDKVGTRRSATP